MRLGKLRFVYYLYAICYVIYMTMKPGWLLYSEDIYTSRQARVDPRSFLAAHCYYVFLRRVS